MPNSGEGTREKFDKSFVLPYERLSAITGAYETTAKIMAKRLATYNKGPIVAAEIGSGTGNSSVVFLENLPIKSLICLEQDGFVWTAGKKMNVKIGQDNVTPYMTEMSKRLRPFKDKVTFVQGRSPMKEEDGLLPMAQNSLDAILCSQSFHWLNFHLALNNFRRVLREGGTLSLDESGFQIDLGNELNNKHVTKHPLYLKFQEILQRILFENKLVANRELVRVEFLFTPDSLKKLIESYGFELIKETDADFELTILPYNLDQVRAATYDGARMRVARFYPNLSSEEVDAMIMKAKVETETFEFREVQGIYAETFANFLFKKKTKK